MLILKQIPVLRLAAVLHPQAKKQTATTYALYVWSALSTPSSSNAVIGNQTPNRPTRQGMETREMFFDREYSISYTASATLCFVLWKRAVASSATPVAVLDCFHVITT
jgi:hypothetical protein